MELAIIGYLLIGFGIFLYSAIQRFYNKWWSYPVFALIVTVAWLPIPVLVCIWLAYEDALEKYDRW